MAMATSKSQVSGLFAHLARACGRRVATAFNDVGAWGLDYNPVYGGYVIYEVANEGGAQHHPFGSERHKAAPFWYMMRFALTAIERCRGGGSSGSPVRGRRGKAGKFIVRGKSGRIVGQYKTRAEAEHRIAQLKAGATRLKAYRFGK
jgi:hypothetical protein